MSARRRVSAILVLAVIAWCVADLIAHRAFDRGVNVGIAVGLCAEHLAMNIGDAPCRTLSPGDRLYVSALAEEAKRRASEATRLD